MRYLLFVKCFGDHIDHSLLHHQELNNIVSLVLFFTKSRVNNIICYLFFEKIIHSSDRFDLITIFIVVEEIYKQDYLSFFMSVFLPVFKNECQLKYKKYKYK